MEWKDKKLNKLFITDWGCCDDYVARNEIYSVHFNNVNTPAFMKIYQSVELYNGYRPKELLDRPFRFEVLNENYKLRSEPIIDDISYAAWDEEEGRKNGTGNVVGKLHKGAKGTAIAKSVDNTGREWWYVEIDEADLPKDHVLYIENKFTTRIRGWISSRYAVPL
jgi:hypothetical protein